MLFNSPGFLFLFLPATFIAFFVAARRSRDLAAAVLGAASLVFYGWWSVASLPLLLGSIAANFAFGRELARRRSRGLLALALAANLLVLGYFKYADFFIANLNDVLGEAGSPPLGLLHIILPIGISFYTFTQIAFLVDCWQGKVRETRFVHYLLFVSYFPHLIAGPILHHAQLMPQFREASTYRIDLGRIFTGLTIFGVGLAKKIVVADSLADFANGFFAAAAGGQRIGVIDGWGGALAYTLQLYFDFSAYSEMAIGVSLLFGIALPVNFNAPYRATSIVEFWRRWHMSLSTFLRDYLYIPLGGNRKGELRRYLNLFATMLLGGLWHGASWTFVVWGGLHGSYLAINHLWNRYGRPASAPGRLRRGGGWLLTFVAVVVAWVVFRADDLPTAGRVLAGMAGFNGATVPAQVAEIIPAFARLFGTVGNMTTLGGGTVMGTFEQACLIAFALALALFGRRNLAMTDVQRLTVIALSTGFVIHSLFFNPPRQFLYFQF